MGLELPLIIGGLGVGAVLLIRPDIVQGLFRGPTVVTTTPAPPVTESVPQAVQSTPTIGQIVVTPDIILASQVNYLIVIPHCDLDDLLDRDADAFASVKIWEVQYNQLATTIIERNQLALMRCNIIHWYRSINISFPFSDPIREHCRQQKLVIIDEFNRGTRDSPRANSAAHQVAQVTTPITVNCKNCTVNIQNQVAVSQSAAPPPAPPSHVNAPPAPGANTPPIHPAAGALGQGGAITTPVTTHQCPHGQAWSASTATCVSTSGPATAITQQMGPIINAPRARNLTTGGQTAGSTAASTAAFARAYPGYRRVYRY
jgi:hypothetical protein